jgi:hypothetical protein
LVVLLALIKAVMTVHLRVVSLDLKLAVLKVAEKEVIVVENLVKVLVK